MALLDAHPSWEHLIKVGINKVVSGNSVPQTIWEAGTLYQYLPTTQVLEIVSSNAADSAAGAGARTVTIVGLDVNWNRQTETITMNGLTPVATSLSWWRINGMFVATAGSTGNNVGNVILRRTGGGITQEYMAAGIGIARSMVYSVPANYSLRVNVLAIGPLDTTTTNNAINCRAKNRNGVTGVIQYPTEAKVMTNLFPPYRHEAHPSVTYDQKTDYSWEVYDSSVNANRAVFLYLSSILVSHEFTGSLDATLFQR